MQATRKKIVIISEKVRLFGRFIFESFRSERLLRVLYINNKNINKKKKRRKERKKKKNNKTGHNKKFVLIFDLFF